MRRRRTLVALLCILLAANGAVGQSDTVDRVIPLDSTLRLETPKKRHSAGRAALYSAILPGWGQAYNRKYWKLPIIYAGYAGLSYAIYWTACNHRCYRKAYRLVVDNDPLTSGECNGFTDANSLSTQRDFYRRNLDYAIIGTVIWHALQIIDATVDAHFFELRFNEDITLSLEPGLPPGHVQSATPAAYLTFRVDL